MTPKIDGFSVAPTHRVFQGYAGNNWVTSVSPLDDDSMVAGATIPSKSKASVPFGVCY
jgi:hypothetical protein